MRRARARRRLVRDGLFAGVGLGATGLAVAMIVSGNAEKLAAVAGLPLGIASLLMALADFFRQEPTAPDPAAYADDLARTLRAQWLEEAEARRLRDPRVLPLAWTATAREVADESRTRAPGAVGGRVVRVHLDGRLDGRFEEATSQLARGYGQLAQRRLVVIGEPGAGKTVLAMLLTLGLLDTRAPGTPVPVLLPVSSWDPLRERLDDWIVRSLAVPHYSGREEIPRSLLTHGLLLPVLDGLDEIPESARRGAIRGINHAIGGERPVVVTCRAVEYEELIRGGAPRLRQAPVVEVLPVPPEDVIGYLRDTEWPQGVAWGGVVARLRAEPDGPLAEALSTPLMVTTARLVYQRGGTPEELLDQEVFDCRYAVEDHLTHRVVDAVYAPDTRLPEDARTPQRWRPEQARRWLTYLAGYLHDHRERDLNWWLMGGRLLPTWAGPVAGLVSGLLVAFGAAVWVALTEGLKGADETGSVAALTLAIGGGFAVGGSVVWYAVGDPLPGRLYWSLRGSRKRLRRGFRSGVVLSLAVVLPVGAAVTLVHVLGSTRGPGTLQGAEAVATWLTLCFALSVVTGLSLAAHGWLNAPPSRATQVSPANSLAQDRGSALTGALTAGVVFAATGLLGLQAGLLGGGLVFRLANGWPGWPGDGETRDFATYMWRSSGEAFGPENLGYGVPYVLPGMLFALLVLLSRAWPRFVLARLWLAASGKLPWRLMAFLADARRREILRQSGGAYQFRHIRLQEALAARPTYEEPRATPGRPEPAVVRRRVVLAAGVAVAVTGAGVVVRHHEDESLVTFSGAADAAVGPVVFQPKTDDVFWGDGDGAVWRGNLRTGPYRVLAPPRPVRDSETGEPKDQAVDSMAFHPDGRILAVHRPEEMQLWDVRQQPPRRLPTGWNDVVDNLTFSQDGEYFAGLSYGDPEEHWCTVFLRRVDAQGRLTLTEHRKDWHEAAADAVAFLGGGNLGVLAGDHLRMYPVPGFDHGQHLFKVRKKVSARAALTLTTSRQGDRLLVSSGRASELWQLGTDGTWTQVAMLPAMDVAAFHPRDPVLAFDSGGDGTITLWSLAEKPKPWRTLHGHMSWIGSMDFSSDGRLLATGSDDGTVRLWKFNYRT